MGKAPLTRGRWDLGAEMDIYVRISVLHVHSSSNRIDNIRGEPQSVIQVLTIVGAGQILNQINFLLM